MDIKIRGYKLSGNGKKFRSAGAKSVIINIIVTLIAAFVIFYVTLPPINVTAKEFYSFIVSIGIVYIICALITSGQRSDMEGIGDYIRFAVQQCKIPALIVVLMIAWSFVGSAFSLKLFRAGAYRELIKIEDGDFISDVSEIELSQIPSLDRDSAQKLGDRKLGELSDMVSQFEVAEDYSQINYNSVPYRVTPLEYGDIIKWLNNRSEGIPAYIKINMVNQSTEVVRLESGKKIKYTTAEHFGRKIERYVRMRYPMYIFAEPTFEIDDSGVPFWICPKIEKTIGVFGGEDVAGAVMVNAITGESAYYEKKDVPQWVDRLYPADLIVWQYDLHGSLINGYWNSIFGQRGVTKTTNGYNYIAMNDDVYLYTGITSVGGDQSNIGFILSNQRTKETKYYPCAGATEESAMASAEGVVQDLGYRATFPLLLNIDANPTYFIPLKDKQGLVKQYAMVNVRQYQIVATGATREACEKEYAAQLAQNNIASGTQTQNSGSKSAAGTVTDIRSAVIEGNTRYYIQLDGGVYYTIDALSGEDAVILNVGDSVVIEYTEGGGDIKRGTELNRRDE